MPDPYSSSGFKVTVADKDVGGFSECTVAETTVDPIDYRKDQKNPDLEKYPPYQIREYTLKRGTSEFSDFYTWISDVHKTGSDNTRKSITLLCSTRRVKRNPNGQL